MYSRRRILGGSVGVLAMAGAGLWWANRNPRPTTPGPPRVSRMNGAMPYRQFGRTGLQVSELSFGAWAIGGQSYGAVERSESLAALAKAEELGCNLVDTAAVYGDSESVLGEFLAGRRDRWVISTKYSGQKAGMTATLEAQLRALRTDYVDFYMIHWMPGQTEEALFDELARLKQSGKARFTGVSLYTRADILRAIRDPRLDGFMVAVNLVEPDPFMSLREAIGSSGKAILVRSTLKEGFLAGKFTHDTRFTDPADQRSQWSHERVVHVVDQVERFRFLEHRAGSLARAAIAYPLSFPEVSTVVVGVKKKWEAEENFGKVPAYRLTGDELSEVLSLQAALGLRERVGLLRRLREALL